MTLAQKFSSAMNGIDDEFIEEALTYERSKSASLPAYCESSSSRPSSPCFLFTSALAFSPSLRENTLNVLVEIFSDHATFRVEERSQPDPISPVKSTTRRWKRPIVLIREAATGPILPVAPHFSATTVRSFQSPSWPLETA